MAAGSLPPMITDVPAAALAVPGAWQPVLAFVLTAMAAYAAFSRLDRTLAGPPRQRWLGRSVAAALLGIGIAGAQTIALTALTLPRSALFDPLYLLLAAAATIGGTLPALMILSQPRRTQRYYALAALPLVAAIALSHHATLAAMQLPAEIHRDPALWTLAWALAACGTTLAVLLASYIRRRRSGTPQFMLIAAAHAIATAVVGAQLIALAALRVGTTFDAAPTGGIGIEVLVAVLAAIVVLELGAAAFAAGQRRDTEHDVAGYRARLRREQRIDAVTGLPTATVLAESFLRVQRLAVAAQGGVALAVLQLAGLERMLSTQGRNTHDELLSLAAWRLRAVRRDEELIGVLDGGRLVLVLRVADGRDAENRVAEACALFDTPLHDDARHPRMRVAAGVAVWPAHGDTFDRLLANALVALERSSPGTVQLYHAAQREENERRLQVESSLSNAITEGELGLVFQPIADASGQVVSIELLARWNSVQLGAVPPEQFILIAESCGRIGEFDRWLVREAIATTKWLDAAGFPQVRVALNCSPVNLADEHFLEFIERMFRDARVDPGRVDIEVTEAALAEGERSVLEALLRLRTLGVGLTIDDFGIGHSSLARLRDLPVDTLKIDQSFIRDMDHPQGEFLVSGILGLAHGLGLSTIAEGVESEAQRTYLAELGCEYVQGYLISRPLTWRALLDFLGDPEATARAARHVAAE